MPRCSIDPSKMKDPEVFAPVSIKRFIGGPGTETGCQQKSCRVRGSALPRSNEVLFPPQTKFRVKEDGRIES